MLASAALAGLAAGSAVLHPRIDSPKGVDAIVVVEGAADDRYGYARQLARAGVANHIIVSRTPGSTSEYATAIDTYCASAPFLNVDNQLVDIECFSPDLGTTEGEAATATQIAQDRGWSSLLVVTYWGHVSRVRIYFEQCFDGAVYVTDTPRPASISRRYALLHESGGYVKSFFNPAC